MLAAIFREVDRDNSGYIDAFELLSALRTYCGEDISTDEVQALFSAMDTDGNGLIDFPEFLKVMQQWQQQQGLDTIPLFSPPPAQPTEETEPPQEPSVELTEGILPSEPEPKPQLNEILSDNLVELTPETLQQMEKIFQVQRFAHGLSYHSY